MIEPLRLSINVACRADHAFDLWTRRIDAWWPRDHTVSGLAGARIVLEPREGGRIYETTPAGEVHEWGEVLSWTPPTRLHYLWFLATDRAHATEVEIDFVPEGPSDTRIDIEHRGWERLGDAAAPWRHRNESGWSTLLPHYVRYERESE